MTASFVRISILALLLAGYGSAGAAGPAGIDGRVFVSPGWLAAHLADPDVTVVHVGSREAYRAGHVPGAHLLSLGEISVTKRGLSVELPPIGDVVEAFARCGVADDSRIVLCFEGDRVAAATRAWFTLDVIGHGDHAAVLDGGLEAWKAGGGELSSDEPSVHPRTLTQKPSDSPVVDAAWVRDHLYAQGERLIDTRSPTSYTGAGDGRGRVARPGHVPGARNLPMDMLFDESSRLRSAAEVSSAFAGAGVTGQHTVTTYCGVGMAASAVYAVGRQFGYRMRLYDGSYQEWGRNPRLPVARSPAPRP